MYWYYIGSQYFPASMVKALKCPRPRLESAKAEIGSTIKTSPVDMLELDSFANAHLMKCDPCVVQKDFPEMKELKKNLQVESLITVVRDQLEECKSDLQRTEQSLVERMADCYSHPAAQSCFGWRATDLDKYGEDIYWTHTKTSLAAFEKQAEEPDDGNNMLKDAMYPDPVESAYFERMEKKSQSSSEVLPVVPVAPDEANKPRRRGHRRQPTRHVEQPAEEGNTGSKGLPGRKRKGPESSGQHRINSYIQDSMSQIKHVDDIVCQVCNDGDYDDSNMIVICSVLSLRANQ